MRRAACAAVHAERVTFLRRPAAVNPYNRDTKGGKMLAGMAGRRAVMLVAYLAVLAAALAAAFWRLPAALDFKLMDAQQRFLREHYPRPPANDLVLVGLDEALLESRREPVALLHPHLARFLSPMTPS